MVFLIMVVCVCIFLGMFSVSSGFRFLYGFDFVFFIVLIDFNVEYLVMLSVFMNVFIVLCICFVKLVFSVFFRF